MVRLKALSDETRLKILKLVQEDELCVCDVVRALGLSQPTISAHLAKLKRAGLVTERRQGQWTYHRAVPEALAGFGRELAAFLQTPASDIPELRELAAIAAAGECRKEPRE